jgi:hypothetical protein
MASDWVRVAAELMMHAWRSPGSLAVEPPTMASGPVRITGSRQSGAPPS